METSQTSNKNLILTYGVLLGFLSVAFAVVLYVMEMHVEGGWFNFIISIALSVGVLVLAYNHYKKDNGGYMGLSEALKIGLGIALIAGLISVIYQFILTQYIDPDFMQKMLEVQQQKMVENNPELTQEQLDMATSMAEKFSSPLITSAITLITSLFFGFIYALIVGLIMKNPRPENL
jgi:heme O synthase-like polyprenyltransferase